METVWIKEEIPSARALAMEISESEPVAQQKQFPESKLTQVLATAFVWTQSSAPALPWPHRVTSLTCAGDRLLSAPSLSSLLVEETGLPISGSGFPYRNG